MKTITIRDLRQHWPDAEKALATEPEILITRDGKPVARLLPIVEEETPRKRFDPEEHRRWMNEVWGEGVHFDSLTPLLEDREDRKLL
ncbi:MAG: type II toxin-antitoxin system Phd/YefM family antitoxin [Luteolibacter sp.]|uniref:type II toxin-antitoxin system Phd/YefM family antitoxin n=1 Tax=Luteolibacter sp. TaxID=1962973 RepID=UPI003263799C